jgi:hypothetical protein
MKKKFRVWDKFLSKYRNDLDYAISNAGKLIIFYSDYGGSSWQYCEFPDNFIIEHSSDLFDMDGIEIYVGDILHDRIYGQFKEGDLLKSDDLRYVDYSESFSGRQFNLHYLEGGVESGGYYGGISQPDFRKIIGNIHENPELLNLTSTQE